MNNDDVLDQEEFELLIKEFAPDLEADEISYLLLRTDLTNDKQITIQEFKSLVWG
jgi:Ca2+-binding EF-hand superfamily protein